MVSMWWTVSAVSLNAGGNICLIKLAKCTCAHKTHHTLRLFANTISFSRTVASINKLHSNVRVYEHVWLHKVIFFNSLLATLEHLTESNEIV